jgi:hypothetical protein
MRKVRSECAEDVAAQLGIQQPSNEVVLQIIQFHCCKFYTINLATFLSLLSKRKV